MKVALFSDSYEPQINGVVTQLNNLILGLSENNHKVVLVAPSDSFAYKEKEKLNARIFLLPSLFLPSYKDYRITNFFSDKIFRILKDFNPDVVHVHTPFGCGWVGVNSAKCLKKPIVGTFHTLIPDFLTYLPVPFIKETSFAKKVAWSYTRFFYNKCDLITAPSGSLAFELMDHGFRNVVVLPNAINFKQFNRFAKSSYDFDSFKVVYFGRLGFEKNIDVVVRAISVLRSSGIDAHFSIVGSGPAENHLKSLVSELGLSEFVSFIGGLPYEKLPAFISTQDVFVTASTIETQCLTLVEAMAVGLPCVGANFRAIPDSIKDGENGFLFSPGDFEECAEKLFFLAKSKALRKKFGKAGINFSKQFSIDETIKNTLNIYNKVI